MPYFPMGTGVDSDSKAAMAPSSPSTQLKRNRRKRYLDSHPEYFSADLELAGPLALFLSQRLIAFTLSVDGTCDSC
jgi:hypothetical protein